MSFYRIYRPQIIDEIDNIAVREFLFSLLQKNKKDLPHAFLFAGSRGAGKTTAARVIAKLFNCEKPTKTGGPCGKCDQCKTIAEGRNLDVLELDAASNRGIDEIRSLRDGIALAPSQGDYKVYIIDEVHMLTTEAFNALLKTLEEPPAHAVFVLATTDPQKVPATIRSRCVVISFKKATLPELDEALARIVKEEKLDVEKDALRRIATSADGSFRDAVKFLEQLSFHKGKITEDTVNTVLSLATDQMTAEFMTSVLGRDSKRAIEQIRSLVSEGKDIKNFLVYCLGYLEKVLISQATGKIYDAIRSNDIKDLIRRFSQSYIEMKSSFIPELPLELAVIEFCEEEGSEKPKAISDKKDTDEKKIDKEQKDESSVVAPSLGLLTVDRLTECWKDIIEEMKPFNHSVAGVLRSARPKEVTDGIVTIEAFYKFHQEKLSEMKTKEMLSTVLKKLFGEKVRVEVVLGKK